VSVTGGKDPKEVGAMFSAIAQYYDPLNSILSFWQADRWRRRLIMGADLPEDGLVIDLCTGSGEVALGFLTERPEFRGNVYAIDFSAPMIDIARGKVARLGAPYPRRIDFLMGDATDLQFQDDKFDVASVAYGVRNYADAEAGLAEIYRVLKPSGQLNMIEFFSDGITFAPIRWYLDSVVPLLGNIISATRAYSYLRRSSRNFYTRGQFEKLLTSIGFVDILWERMTLGISYIVRARK
jgi:demethylmenaquinone methyltransferase/2-methoxy-6-polyprenyl-1,4-benzoquinol methylase